MYSGYRSSYLCFNGMTWKKNSLETTVLWNVHCQVILYVTGLFCDCIMDCFMVELKAGSYATIM